MKGKISWETAGGLVVANMIGTGVFTSLGYQLFDLKNTWTILALWLLGGVLALIGAFSFAELGTHFKKSGGDYIFLSRVFHPILGYLSAWASLTVGFAAPIAVCAMAMSGYLQAIGFSPLVGKLTGITSILLVAISHCFSLKQSEKFQNSSTLIKLVFILALIGIGLYYAPATENALNFDANWTSELFSGGFAISLIYVSYAYTGWNAAAYIVEEIKDVKKNLPKALILAVLVVTVLYVALQYVFLKHASLLELQGKIEVATISFANILGDKGAIWVAAFIAIQLIGTISGYTWVGSRVTLAMAKEHPLWKKLSVVNQNDIPVNAIILQTGISLLLVATGSFEQILLYAGFTLQLMGTLAISTLLFVQSTNKNFRSPFKPFLQIIYILFSLWILIYMAIDKPLESGLSFVLLFVGLLTYFWNSKIIHNEEIE